MRNWLIVGLACLGLLSCVIGWIGAIFGPRELFACGVFGFGCGLVGHLLSRRLPVAPSASLPPWVFWWATGARALAGTIAIACLIAMFSSSRGDGVADFPALDVR